MKAILLLRFVFLVGTCGALLAPSMASACSCGYKEPVPAAVASAAAVFHARVLSLERVSPVTTLIRNVGPVDTWHPYFVRMRLEVLGTYKGALPREVSVATGDGRMDCGLPLVPGTEYLVYADAADSWTLGADYIINGCDRTQSIAETTDLPELGPSRPPLPDTLGTRLRRAGLPLLGVLALCAGLFLVFRRRRSAAHRLPRT